MNLILLSWKGNASKSEFYSGSNLRGPEVFSSKSTF